MDGEGLRKLRFLVFVVSVVVLGVDAFTQFQMLSEEELELNNLHKSLDANTGNWLFMFGDKYIGYWPKGLLPGLENGAAIAAWGGEVYSPTTEAGPAMGSGHFPEEGYRKSAFVNQIQVAEYSSLEFVDPVGSQLSIVLDKPVCFGLINKFTQAGNWGHHIFFGWPRGKLILWAKIK